MADLPTLSNIAAQVVTGLDAIPEPIKRNFYKAIGALMTGLADVPAAYLEMKAAEFKTRQKGHEIVMLAAAESAASIAKQSPELAKRALDYFANDLVRGQVNRERVIKEAAEAIKLLPAPPENQAIPDIDDDWLHQFRNLAASKSSSEIQAILGRILAGETTAPNSFAPYTLEAVARLDCVTARTFELIANHALIIPGDWDMVITAVPDENGKNLKNILNVSGALMHLQTCGLVVNDHMSQIKPEKFIKLPPCTIGGQRVIISSCEPSVQSNPILFRSQIAYLSTAGGQLQSIVSKKFDKEYARELVKGLQRLGISLAFPDINIDAN